MFLGVWSEHQKTIVHQPKALVFDDLGIKLNHQLSFSRMALIKDHGLGLYIFGFCKSQWTFIIVEIIQTWLTFVGVNGCYPTLLDDHDVKPWVLNFSENHDASKN